MESHESFKEELKGLLLNAIKVCSFKIDGKTVLHGKVPEIYNVVDLSDNDTVDGEHYVFSDIRIEFRTENVNHSDRYKVRIDYIVKGKDVYVKYPIVVISCS